jgi:hypothetical protein
MDDQPQSEDTVELGSRRFRTPGWLPTVRPGVVTVAGLLLGLVAGYAGGVWHTRGSTASPGPAGSGSATNQAADPVSTARFWFAASLPLTQDTGACSAQTRQGLQLGVPVTNNSTVTLTLQAAKAVLPLGGLKQVASQWAPCGSLPSTYTPGAAVILMPGESTWLTVTFQVKPRCPAAYPVQFTVDFLAQGHRATASLPGFADLGQVPYNGCPVIAAASTNAEADRLGP